MAKNETADQSFETTRLQRVLTGMIVGVIGAAILSIIIAIASAAFAWTVLLFVFPIIAIVGMASGMLLIFALMVVTIREKTRQNRQSQ
jgi:mannose/fructose/N-acetylgalactosamine-specific phosphotransferase system component IID